MTQTNIDLIKAAVELAHSYATQGNTQSETVRKVFDQIKTVTSPSAGVYMPTELYDKMTTEGI